MRIIVTGAAGFIGSHLCDRLVLDGHYVIGNCHAGPENPLLIEVDPATKKVVWQFNQYEAFGNNVSNSQLLDVAGSIR